MLSRLIKFTALLLLAVAGSALPASSDNTAASCKSVYARCLHKNAVDFCRDFVCSSFGEECLPCQSGFIPFTATLKTTNIAAHDVTKRGPPRNRCIIICGHAWCRPICTNPGKPPGSTGINDAIAVSNAADLLAVTNAQPDKLGLPFKSGTNTIVLGQKGREKCAWLCGAEALTCEEKCWVPDNVEDAAVSDGGELAQGELVDGMTTCQVVAKGEVGKVVVCHVSHADVEHSTGNGMDWGNTRCMLFWRNHEPQLVCHGV